jgi:uncharacterized protein (TIGR02145 family)
MKQIIILLLSILLHACSSDENQTTNNQPAVEIVTDIEGCDYEAVQIGEQIWLNSNLKVSKYNDGSPITELRLEEEWEDAEDDWIPARCIYDNNSSLKDSHGYLYNFWAELRIFLDPSGTPGNNIAGGPLKALGTSFWRAPNKDASNSTGFSAIPSGDRSASSGRFDDLDRDANFWSSTSEAPDSGGGRSHWVNLTFGNGELLFLVPIKKGMGFSCRCIKN